MELSARDDIEAPIDFVFAQVTDLANFERAIMRRGGDVERVSGGDEAKVGVEWQVTFRLRGKDRELRAQITDLEEPNSLTVGVKSENVDGRMVVDLVALSRARTQITVKIDAHAKTLPAKLLFQSMRFGRQRVVGRFKSLVSGFAEDVQARYPD